MCIEEFVYFGFQAHFGTGSVKFLLYILNYIESAL